MNTTNQHKTSPKTIGPVGYKLRVGLGELQKQSHGICLLRTALNEIPVDVDTSCVWACKLVESTRREINAARSAIRAEIDDSGVY